ncbi:MAG: molybdopterin-binding protein [Mycobacterium sp.]
MKWDLLEKTELRIEQIILDDANLTDIAAAVADELELRRDEVIVIDARGRLLALDILRPTIDPYALIGKRDGLLRALGSVAGVTVTDRTAFCSEGVLGWISSDAAQATVAVERSREMATEISERIAHRAIVCSTGPEVCSGQITDTNKPWIAARLRACGFAATAGPDLPDDTTVIAAAMREAVQERGFGLVITTGGVGAEDKDGTVEALLTLDPDAATPPLFEVRQGHGRHVKPCVRIGVGRLGDAVIVCLPGPHAEATAAVDVLADKLQSTRDKYELANEIAGVLRARLRAHEVSR